MPWLLETRYPEAGDEKAFNSLLGECALGGHLGDLVASSSFVYTSRKTKAFRRDFFMAIMPVLSELYIQAQLAN
jgi:hypothetical protein